MDKQQKQQLNKKFTKEFLIKLYWNDKLSHNDIVRKYNITYGYIRGRFKELNIPARTNKEGTKIAITKRKITKKDRKIMSQGGKEGIINYWKYKEKSKRSMSQQKYLKSDACQKRRKKYQKKWQKSEVAKKWRYSAGHIYSRIKQRSNKKNIPICSKQEFVDWYNKQIRECVYCNIPEKYLSSLNWGWKGKCNRLTIDRKNNNKGYTLDNIQLICYVCNFTKSDVFNHLEMKNIISKAIKKVWEIRIKSQCNRSA